MEKSKFNIKELDEALFGGIPKKNSVLLNGTPGAGKTILTLQWLFNGIKKQNEKGIYITLTESESKLKKNMQEFNFFDLREMEKGNIFIYDLRYINSKSKKRKKIIENPFEIIEFALDFVKKAGISRLVIDSITSLCQYVEKKDIRNFIWRLSEALNAMDCTVIFISEKVLPTKCNCSYVEEFISDGIISLEQIERKDMLIKTLQIVKMRSTNHSNNKFKLDITKKGISLMPLITND